MKNGASDFHCDKEVDAMYLVILKLKISTEKSTDWIDQVDSGATDPKYGEIYKRWFSALKWSLISNLTIEVSK